jgi:Mn2+/Fe2+ NRAMP family transporter
MIRSEKLRGTLQTLGPGILFAGAAIGGSHLVQSTRAGANYGFSLIWLVVLVLIFKYPFFEFSHRYTTATGESILQGYRRLGKFALWIFFIIATLVAVINVATVTLVAAGLFGNLLRINWSPVLLTLLTLTCVAVILLIGKFPTLDRVMKLMVAFLGIMTITTVVIAFLHHGQPLLENISKPEIWSLAGVSFLLALMGWMPAPVDVAVWPSLWALERKAETRHSPTMREALIDFNTGYITTGILAIAFVCLGALIMFGSGLKFSNSSVQFSEQLVSLYTATLGTWSRLLISLVAFITMFSTSLTTCDGYSRTLKSSIEILFARDQQPVRWLYWMLLILLMGATLIIVGLLMNGIKSLIDVATIIAFLTAPVLATLNFILVTSSHTPKVHQPRRGLRLLSWLGILFLTAFSLIYIYWRLFAA